MNDFICGEKTFGWSSVILSMHSISRLVILGTAFHLVVFCNTESDFIFVDSEKTRENYLKFLAARDKKF